MKYEMFINEVVTRVEKVFTKDNYEVNVNKVFKNNGIQLDGLVIHKMDSVISPSIYLNTFYEKYTKGEKIEQIVNEIVHIYYESNSSDIASRLDLDYNFENMRDRIVFKVINFDKNRRLLRDIPFIKFLNLAVIFQCVLDTDIEEEGVASIRVTNDNCLNWGITTQDLMRHARENTPRLFPAVIKNMKEVIRDLMIRNGGSYFGEMIDGMISDLDMLREDSNCYYYESKHVESSVIDKMIEEVTVDNSFEMYVLTNVTGINGASTILYNGILEGFANRLNKDLFIIPSSIHETIIIPKGPDIAADSLRELVCEVNNNEVQDDEVLADSVYEYSRRKRAIMLVN